MTCSDEICRFIPYLEYLLVQKHTWTTGQRRTRPFFMDIIFFIPMGMCSKAMVDSTITGIFQSIVYLILTCPVSSIEDVLVRISVSCET